MPNKLLDIEGLKFGKLTAIERLDSIFVGKDNNKKFQWKFLCECGCEYITVGSYVKRGRIKSCGCDKNRKDKNGNWQGFGEIPKSKWRVIGQNAIQRKLEFTITIEFINELYKTQQRKCALSGMHIDMKNASLDRVNSYKGYTPDNIQWVHKKINKLKGQYDDGEFIDLCRKVANYNVLI